eukprot:gene46213-57632_t
MQEDMNEPKKEAPPPRPATTVLLLRPSQPGDAASPLEVFMVVRHHQIDSFSGALVFPGGKLEDADGSASLRARCGGADAIGDAELKFRVAGVREAFEECGVLLARKRGQRALIAAAEALADTEGLKTAGPREIVLISDLQAGSHTEAIQGYEWPKGVTVVVEALTARAGTNAGVQVLPDLVDGDRQAAATVRVRVTNAPDAKREEFKIGWVRAGESEFVGAPVETYVPPGQTRIVALPAATAAGAQAITLRGDDEDFDNTVFVVPPTPQPVAI